MNTSFYIARRYLFARKSKNLINLISAISVVVLAGIIGAAIVVLSAFNGIEQLVDTLYKSFDADISIRPVEGRTVSTDSIHYEAIKNIPHITYASFVIEEDVLIDYNGNKGIATLRGVEPTYIQKTGIDTCLVDGMPHLIDDGYDFMIVGLGIKYELGIPWSADNTRPIKVYAPIKGKSIRKDKEAAFNKQLINFGGVYSINLDFDTKYVLSSLDFASTLFDYQNQVSGMEINVADDKKIEATQKELQALLGDKFKVKTRYQKNELIYQANKSEKVATFFIMIFILMIAAFNIIGSLSMLILDKKNDIRVLKSMGATKKTIRRIFFYEGLLINFFGLLIGLILGFVFCLVQQKFGIIPIEGSIIDYYPVVMEWQDFALVAVSAITMAFISSSLPVRFLTKKYF